MELMSAHSQCTKGNFTNHCENRLFHLVLNVQCWKAEQKKTGKATRNHPDTVVARWYDVSTTNEPGPLTSFPNSINKSSTQTANKSFDNLFEYNSLYLHQRNGLNQMALVSIEILLHHHAPSFRENVSLERKQVAIFFSSFFSFCFLFRDRHECCAI